MMAWRSHLEHIRDRLFEAVDGGIGGLGHISRPTPVLPVFVIEILAVDIPQGPSIELVRTWRGRDISGCRI